MRKAWGEPAADCLRDGEAVIRSFSAYTQLASIEGARLRAPEGQHDDLADAFVRLSYTWVWTATGQTESADYHVTLTATRPRFEGLRWWFVCPLVIRGRPCGRRVGKLYLPPASRYFGCRTCHDLTYTSAQTHDKRRDFFRRVPHMMALKALEARLQKLKDAERGARRL